MCNLINVKIISAKKKQKKENEKHAFQLILEAGDDGILQIEMRNILGVNSTEGSRVALKFLKREAIKRQRELHDGRWTYRLFSVKKPVTVDSIMDCPCMNCDEIEKCTPGRFVSPTLCEKLTYWMDINTDIGHVQLEEFNEDNV